MPRYRFEALTYAGKSERGSVEGESVRAVRQALMAKQLVPVTIDLETEWGKQRFWNKWFSEKIEGIPVSVSLGKRKMKTEVLTGNYPIEIEFAK